MQELGKLKFNINVMPNGLEKYVTFNPTMPGGGGEGLVSPRLTFVVYIPRTKNVEALRLNDFS